MRTTVSINKSQKLIAKLNFWGNDLSDFQSKSSKRLRKEYFASNYQVSNLKIKLNKPEQTYKVFLQLSSSSEKKVKFSGKAQSCRVDDQQEGPTHGVKSKIEILEESLAETIKVLIDIQNTY